MESNHHHQQAPMPPLSIDNLYSTFMIITNRRLELKAQTRDIIQKMRSIAAQSKIEDKEHRDLVNKAKEELRDGQQLLERMAQPLILLSAKTNTFTAMPMSEDMTETTRSLDGSRDTASSSITPEDGSDVADTPQDCSNSAPNSPRNKGEQTSANYVASSSSSSTPETADNQEINGDGNESSSTQALAYFSVDLRLSSLAEDNYPNAPSGTSAEGLGKQADAVRPSSPDTENKLLITGNDDQDNNSKDAASVSSSLPQSPRNTVNSLATSPIFLSEGPRNRVNILNTVPFFSLSESESPENQVTSLATSPISILEGPRNQVNSLAASHFSNEAENSETPAASSVAFPTLPAVTAINMQEQEGLRNGSTTPPPTAGSHPGAPHVEDYDQNEEWDEICRDLGESMGYRMTGLLASNGAGYRQRNPVTSQYSTLQTRQGMRWH